LLPDAFPKVKTKKAGKKRKEKELTDIKKELKIE